ncbi:MAG: hypothetical protein IH629_05275, partial [Thermoleophilia bacterium]|nr:hypothetical protein [Thermoleophilia bacterium]
MSDTESEGPVATPTMAAAAATVGVPDFLLPWLDRFYDEDDAELILAAAAPTAGGGPGINGDGETALA